MSQKDFEFLQPIEQGLDSVVQVILQAQSEEDLDLHFSGFIRPANRDILVGYVNFAVAFSKRDLLVHANNKTELIRLLVLKLKSNLRILQDRVEEFEKTRLGESEEEFER